MRKLTLLKLGGLVLLIAGLVVAGLLVDIEALADRDRLRASIEEDPWRGIGLFLGVSIGVKLLFVPASPMSMVAGYLFGGVLGTALSVLSMTISSLVTFGAGRTLGRGVVRALIEERWRDLERYDRKIERHGFLTTLFLRLVPTLPLAAVNIGLGVTSVGWRDFTLATVAGALPGVFLLANVGHRLDDPKNPWLYVFAALFLTLTLGTLLVARRLRSRSEDA